MACFKKFRHSMTFSILTLSAILIIAGLSSSVAEAAVEFSAKIFEAGSNKQKQLYSFERTAEEKSAGLIVETIFKDLQGQVAITEYAELVPGESDKVKLYKQSHKQLGAEGIVEVKNGKAHFTYTIDGKTKSSSESVGENFVVTPTILTYLQKRWEKIKKGESIEIRLGVLDRLETVGFEYFKDKEMDLNGTKAVVVKMKPSSMIIAALVKPLYFYFSEDGRRLLEVHGRVMPKQKVDNKFKDLDAVTVYEYPSVTAVAPAVEVKAAPAPSKKK